MKILVLAMSALMLSACGGGGGGGDSVNTPVDTSYGAGQVYTYHDQGGLTWSSPSKATYVFLQITSDSTAQNASSYCSQSTSVNGGPVTMTNFNKSAGWRLPSLAEIQSLRAETPTPANWTLDELWISGLPKNRFTFDFEVWPRTYDFKTGGISLPAASQLAHVTCVKPIVK